MLRLIFQQKSLPRLILIPYTYSETRSRRAHRDFNTGMFRPVSGMTIELRLWMPPSNVKVRPNSQFRSANNV